MTAPSPLLAGQQIAQRIHTAWRSQDGAPAGIKALAQSADGALWIGSQWGLYRFDGKIFMPVDAYAGTALPAGGVASVIASRDGAIWVGYSNGGVVRIDTSAARLYHAFQAGEDDWVSNLSQSEDGTIWCATGSRLMHLAGDRFIADSVAPGKSVRRFVADTGGNAWLGTQSGLLERPHGKQDFAPVAGNFGIILAMAALPGGGVLVSDFDLSVSRGRTQRLDDTGKVIDRLPGHDVAYTAMIGHDGSVWLGTQTKGLVKAQWPGTGDGPEQPAAQVVDSFRRTDGLTSDSVPAVLEDRDGNIWAGTKTGLDRFRLAALSTFSNVDDASNWFVCSGAQGDVWIADSAGKLFRAADGAAAQYRALPQNITALGCGRTNDAWFATLAGFGHAVSGSDVQPIPRPPGSDLQAPTQLLALKDGTVLNNASAEMASGTIWRLRDGAWSDLPVFRQDGGVQKVFVDPSDRLWVVPRKRVKSLDRIEDGKAVEIRTIPASLGKLGPVIQSSFGLLFGGQYGVAVSTGGDFRILSLSDTTAAYGVSGLVQARNGDVWFIASRGIVQLAADQIGAALGNSDAKVRVKIYQENNFVGRNGACSCWNAAAMGADGKLWFAGLTGVVSIDPAALPPRPHPPALLLRSILADEQPWNFRHEVQPNPRTLRISYAGINLSEPDSVVYRYKLDGVDKVWQDVGKDTGATYTSLRPARYVFQVVASNGDGNWTDPLKVPFTVLPSFYQTYWFTALTITLVGLSLWSLQAAYVRYIVALTRAKADARSDERIRIARDLHDTLLQGVQGLLLHVHVAARSVPPDHPSALMLDRALSAATKIIVEGRHSVCALRSISWHPADLVAALDEVGRDLNADHKIQFSVECCALTDAEALRFRLAEHVTDQVFSAAREAVTNAFHHAQASNINVVLSYSRKMFTLRCRDDGIGCTTAALERDHQKDRWGIRGMQERIAAVGGKLTFGCEPGYGTVVTIVIPASKAYCGHGRWKVAFGQVKRR